MKISLVVPCYNVEKYLNECLDSIAAAVSKCRGVAIEVICVDDGSIDATGAILDKHAAHESYLRVIHQTNAGEGAARNAGLSVATGDWLMYLDSDDLLAPWAFSETVRIVSMYTVADLVAYGSTIFQDGDNYNFSKGQDQGQCQSECLNLTNEIPSPLASTAVWQMAYRRDTFANLRFNDCTVGADIVYTSQCFSIAKSIVLTPTVCHAYRIRSDSMAHRAMSIRKLSDQIRYLKEMFQNLLLSGKQIGVAFTRCRGNMLLEACPSEILMHADPEWNEVWGEWLASLVIFRHNAAFSLWQRTVASILTITRSRILAHVLCRIPHQLKLMGFHRAALERLMGFGIGNIVETNRG